ncbi:hypothetical protein [Capnocytophaga stomatis]|uniref:hypothetical protein n=1 Tax=Capnocytophaga stomatis TaxID=1848904 RepID=UPI001AD42977|nr:hypothetical protein [Capnocytophaga stomatis]GIM50531.1 hypothetical protein CAPN003_19830 [Capnocytophaga stomatis]
MKKYITLLIFISSLSLFSQNFDELMEKRQLSCSDVSYNSTSLFEEYYNNNNLESAKRLLEYWEGKCGLTEPLQRAKLLLSIYENRFFEGLLTDRAIYYIISYQNRMQLIEEKKEYLYENYASYYDYVPIGKDFDKFTQKEFEKLKEKFKTESTEYLLCDFYSGNHNNIFEKLQENTYETSFLVKEYKERVSEFIDLPEAHLSILTGAWIPTGKLNVLGTHPELGFQLGLKNKKMNYDFVMSIRFLKSANEYMAKRDKEEDYIPTRHFFGGHIGAEVGRDIYRKGNNEIQIVSGLAFDGFDALKKDEEAGLKSASTTSYNINFGIAYRYYFKNNAYLGLRIKYNIVDYTLNKVVNLTGNPISLQLSIGWLENQRKKSALETLQYKKRR